MKEAAIPDYLTLSTYRYFLITRDIYELEKDLQIRVPNSRFRTYGTGENPENVDVFSDCLHNTRRFEYPWVTQRIPRGINSLLDVGGSSSWTLYISRKIPYVTIVDIDPGVEKDIEKIRHYTNCFHNVNTVTVDWLHNKLPDACFDCTVSISTIEHMGKDTLGVAIDEMRRVTKPNGTIIFTIDVDLEQTPSIPVSYALSELKRLGITRENIVSNNDFILGNKLPNGVITVICVAFTNNEVNP